MHKNIPQSRYTQVYIQIDMKQKRKTERENKQRKMISYGVFQRGLRVPGILQ